MLVVDDEHAIRESLRMILEYEGLQVEEASSGTQALAKLGDITADAVLLDIKMPDMDGLTVLERLGERSVEVPVIMVSGHADIQTAVEATRLGAFDFIEKPLQRERVLVSLRRALAKSSEAFTPDNVARSASRLVGETPAMQQLRAMIARAAPTPATVLITGESGTGKELIAQALHEGSPRHERPLVQVNCAAIPDELIESELFGHEKGSFTGAVRRQVGKFVAADGGTIFLDEIGDMSARTQAKVLRVLQSGEVEPVGAGGSQVVDVRVIAATHRDLPAAIEEGEFREDLYYRLNVLPIESPPLRRRLEDVPLLVDHFIQEFASRNGYPEKSVSEEAMNLLRGMPWPGNVRELRNAVERLLIFSRGDEIGAEEVLTGLGDSAAELPSALLAAHTLKEFKELSEAMFLRHKLDENDWNVSQTAQAIETPRSNLYKKMEQYGIKRAQ